MKRKFDHVQGVDNWEKSSVGLFEGTVGALSGSEPGTYRYRRANMCRRNRAAVTKMT
jgi:hypothetical protein